MDGESAEEESTTVSNFLTQARNLTVTMMMMITFLSSHTLIFCHHNVVVVGLYFFAILEHKDNLQ